MNLTLGSLLLLSSFGQDRPIRVLVYGDSLTAGYQLEKSHAYPAILQEKADAAGLAVVIVNAGVSGDTSAGGLARLNWTMRQPIDVLLLELGANDGLRGIAPEQTQINLQAIIDGVRARYPAVVILLAGMKLPPNLGADYSAQFEAIFPRLAERNGARLIPFLLAGVAAIPELNLADGIHPNEAGHRVVAETVWPHLSAALEQDVVEQASP